MSLPRLLDACDLAQGNTIATLPGPTVAGYGKPRVVPIGYQQDMHGLREEIAIVRDLDSRYSLIKICTKSRNTSHVSCGGSPIGSFAKRTRAATFGAHLLSSARVVLPGLTNNDGAS